MKRWQSIALGLAVSVFTLWLALRGNDLSKIGAELQSGNYLYVIPGILLMVLALIARIFRWRFLLANRISTMHSFHITNIAYLLNVLLPLRLGEIARAFLTTRLTPPLSIFTSFSSIVVERLLDLLAVLIIVVIAVMIAPVPQQIIAAAMATGVLAFVGLAVLAILAVRRDLAHRILDVVDRILPFVERLGLRHTMDRLLDGIEPLGSIRGMIGAVGWTVVSWFFSILAVYVLFFVFFDHATWLAALLVLAGAALAVALPAMPGNVGPFELAVMAGLAGAGFAQGQSERAFAYALLIHVANVLVYIVMGMIGLQAEKITLGELTSAAQQATRRLRKSNVSNQVEQVSE